MTTTSLTAPMRSRLLKRLPRLRVVTTLVQRDYLMSRSYRLAFVIDAVFGILNLTVFFFISRTVGEVQTEHLKGAPTYFAFAAVGLAMSLVVQAASTGLARRVREEQLTGTLEMLVAQPVTATEMSLGLAGFPFAFATFRAAAYLLLAGAVLGLDLSRTDWLGFVAILAASGSAITAIGIALAALVIIIKRGEVLTGMAVFALGMVSGALFPVDVLPVWLSFIGKAMPTRFAFDGLRSALFLGDMWLDEAVALVLFSVVSIPAATALFRGALAYARRSGSLTQY